jgi:acyl-CoA thioesterase FadM
MYPFFRLIGISLKASRAPAQSFDTEGVCHFRAHPWDIDMFGEMNNGRHLTLYDLGRFDLSIKAGLARILKEQRWGLVVAGCTVRFRKRIRMFDKVTMRTRLLGWDDRWFYLYQAMYVDGQPCSSALLRTGITKAGRTVATDEVAAAMGLDTTSAQLPDWANAWIGSDKDKPWPPEFVG